MRNRRNIIRQSSLFQLNKSKFIFYYLKSKEEARIFDGSIRLGVIYYLYEHELSLSHFFILFALRNMN